DLGRGTRARLRHPRRHQGARAARARSPRAADAGGGVRTSHDRPGDRPYRRRRSSARRARPRLGGAVSVWIERARSGLRTAGDRAARVLACVTTVGRVVAALGVVSWLVAWRLGWSEFAAVAVGCVAALAVGSVFAIGRDRIKVVISLEPK